MKFLRKNKNRKLVLFAVLAAVLIIGLAPQVAMSAKEEQKHLDLNATTNVTDIEKAGTITYALVSFVGWLLALIASLIDFAINLGDSVLNLTAVKEGWKIMLQFTNLGFILGIIIIAFATILHLESYALKQILWKLIVAAILVNFSLVIAGAFMSVSKITTDHFLKATTPKNLSNALGEAFKPQALTKPKDTDILTKLINPLTTAVNYMISLLFTAIFLFLMVLAFLTLFIMLMVRIIALSFLLILSPLIWLCWIFPKTQTYWTQWWSQFIKWNFFAPAVMFFLYLTVLTSQHMGDIEGPTKVAENEAAKAAANMIMNNDGILVHLANVTILLGMLFGGIYVANKFSIAGGSIGVNMASKVGKGVSGWAGRNIRQKGSQYATFPFRAKLFGKEGEKKSVGESLVNWSKNRGWFARQTIGNVARGITRIETAGGENIVKQHEKEVAGKTNSDLKAEHVTAGGVRRMVIEKELAKRKDMGDLNATRIITDGNKATYERFRQGKSFEEVENASGMNIGMAKELKNMNEGKEYDKEKLLEETQKFTGRLAKGKEAEQVPWKAIFGGKSKLGLSEDSMKKFSEYLAGAIGSKNPAIVSNVISKLDSKGRDNFSKLYEEIHKNNPEILNSFKQTVANYTIGWASTEVEVGGEKKSKESEKPPSAPLGK